VPKPLINYHAVSVTFDADGMPAVRHTWIDHATRRVCSENLDSFVPPYGPPPTWHEHLLIGVSALLERDGGGHLGLW
jgi:hypothetical protein